MGRTVVARIGRFPERGNQPIEETSKRCSKSRDLLRRLLYVKRMADKSTALYTRVMPTLREALNAFAERHGMDAAMVVRILIAQAIERDLRRDDDTVRVCVECGQVVRPDAEGRPQWHRHRGILYGEQEQL